MEGFYIMDITWPQLNDSIKACTRCRLCNERTNTVMGRGSEKAKILFVGEGPGRQEDESGIPFVGQAGMLLDSVLDGLGFDPDDYYIANVVKCRPPQNRTPLEDECKTCLPFLRAQFALIRPAIVVCLGSVALKYLMMEEARITKDRGKWMTKGNTMFIATYHPAALLRDPDKKVDFWHDLRIVRQELDRINGRK